MTILKLLTLLFFFISFLLTFNMVMTILEMIDEKENIEYKNNLGNTLRIKAIVTALTWTSFIACLIF